MKKCTGFLILLLIVLISCKSTDIPKLSTHQFENSYKVKRVKKEKNNVYVIIATRNDSLFKICTYYDKNIPIAGKKVKRGSQLDLKMYSQIRAAEEAFNMMPVCNIAIDFHDVTISRGDFDDILICPELNGLYHK